MIIEVDFENTYEPLSISEDLKEMIFLAPQKSGESIQLLVQIGPYDEVNFPRVYNLGFGPPNLTGTFNDKISLAHLDYNKTFSTILLYGYLFLEQHPEFKLGIDGSDDRRAAIYHKMYINNKDYLEKFFQPIGVDWYVRVFRDGTFEMDNNNNLIPRPRPEVFDYSRTWHDLYRYYMFQINN